MALLEDTWGEGGEWASAVEDQDGRSSGYRWENAEDIDGQVQETPLVVQESWVKELTKIEGIDGYHVGNTSNANPCSSKEKG